MLHCNERLHITHGSSMESSRYKLYLPQTHSTHITNAQCCDGPSSYDFKIAYVISRIIATGSLLHDLSLKSMHLYMHAKEMAFVHGACYIR
ncbi:hypothetical protein Plhal304r1_c023g0080591 [Plasmopara halstedii]